MLGRFLILATGLGAAAGPATGRAASLVHTNWSERCVTNLIEVTVPLNRFLTLYHTNLVELVRTNVQEEFQTNLVTQTLTRHQTVESVLTNYVTAYQTNWRTLTLTNWETVLVMRTNWVTQPMTNVVQIDLPARSSAAPQSPAPRASAEPKPAQSETSAALPATAASGALTLEATRMTRPAPRNLVPVQLKVRWSVEEGKALQVQQWRIEQEDGGILCFGPTAELQRELPAGTYRVEVKVRKDASGSFLAARGTLLVSAHAVLFKPTLTAKR